MNAVNQISFAFVNIAVEKGGRIHLYIEEKKFPSHSRRSSVAILIALFFFSWKKCRQWISKQ